MIRITMFMLAAARDLLSLTLVLMVRCYQRLVSPWLPNACRYQPTCSEYAVLAVRRYGPLRGMLKALGRIARCHPWGRGGYDPP